MLLLMFYEGRRVHVFRLRALRPAAGLVSFPDWLCLRTGCKFPGLHLDVPPQCLRGCHKPAMCSYPLAICKEKVGKRHQGERKEGQQSGGPLIP